MWSMRGNKRPELPSGIAVQRTKDVSRIAAFGVLAQKMFLLPVLIILPSENVTQTNTRELGQWPFWLLQAEWGVRCGS